MNGIRKNLGVALAVAVCPLFANAANAADWSITELQYQYGKLDSPFAGGAANTSVVTLQHASGYSFGDVFFFVDMIDDGEVDGFNDKDAYGELYTYFSSAKILKRTYSGLIKDVGLMAGVNYDADAGFLSYMPGVYVDWNVPGFTFLRTHFAATVDDSDIAQKDGFQGRPGVDASLRNRRPALQLRRAHGIHGARVERLRTAEGLVPRAAAAPLGRGLCFDRPERSVLRRHGVPAVGQQAGHRRGRERVSGLERLALLTTERRFISRCAVVQRRTPNAEKPRRFRRGFFLG
jgi:hypothetical protein